MALKLNPGDDLGGPEPTTDDSEETPWQPESSTNRGTQIILGVLDLLRCDNPMQRATVIATAGTLFRTTGRSYMDIGDQIHALGVDAFLAAHRSIPPASSTLTGLPPVAAPPATPPPSAPHGQLLESMRAMNRIISNTLRQGQSEPYRYIAGATPSDNTKRRRK